jgi:hypothetical protein
MCLELVPPSLAASLPQIADEKGVTAFLKRDHIRVKLSFLSAFN